MIDINTLGKTMLLIGALASIRAWRIWRSAPPQKHEQHWDGGYAFEMGFHDNPYPKGTTQYTQWQREYDDSAAQLRAAHADSALTRSAQPHVMAIG